MHQPTSRGLQFIPADWLLCSFLNGILKKLSRDCPNPGVLLRVTHFLLSSGCQTTKLVHLHPAHFLLTLQNEV